MSDLERNRNIVLRYLDGRRTFDTDVLEEVLHPDFFHYMHGKLEDRPGLFETVAREKASGLGELEQLEIGTVAEGDRVAVRYTWRGRNPQSGEPITFSGMFIAVVQGGQMTTGWGEMDRLGLYRQLGRV
jgi:predicted ester cyclase